MLRYLFNPERGGVVGGTTSFLLELSFESFDSHNTLMGAVSPIAVWSLGWIRDGREGVYAGE